MSDALHTAICQAVGILNMAPELARHAEGRQVRDILRQALIDYADAALTAPAVPADMVPEVYALGLVQVVSRKQANGTRLWAVLDNSGNVLNKAGEWEWELWSCSRDDEFLARCRFESPLAARDAYMRHLAAAPQAPAP